MRVEVYRGSYLESVHAFSACIVDTEGAVIYEAGDIDRAYPLRSLVKPFLARAFLECGAIANFGFGDMEIALAAGSHDGEPHHVATVRGILDKIGLHENALLCGPAFEGKVLVGPPVANNCSGKHAAVLAMCRHLQFPIENYIDPAHPIQRFLQPLLMDAFGCAYDTTPCAIDGCGMPIFGATLRQIATAYSTFGVAGDAGSLRVRGAMRAYPEYVGGRNGNLDTRIIQWSGGRMLGKIGAEGLYADALTDRSLGFAVKVHDGNSRALPAAIGMLFEHVGAPNPVTPEYVAFFARQPVENAAGRTTGEVHIGRAPMHDSAAMD